MSVQGQTCVPWDGEPSYCGQFEAWQVLMFSFSSVPNVHIYVPLDWTLDSLQTPIRTAVNVAGAMGDDGSLGSRCRRMWARLACATFLRPCANITDEGGEYRPTPVQTCRFKCEEYEATCREHARGNGAVIGLGLYFPPGYSRPLTCNEMDVDEQNFYQSANYSVAVPLKNDTEIYQLQCNRVESGGALLLCEPPLENVGQTNNCAFECPLPSYTEEQYDSVKTLQLVLSWLSWAGSLVVILSYALHSKLRKFPANLILMAAVAAHAEAVGMILPTFFGYDNTWCGFDTAYLIPESKAADGTLVITFHIRDLSVDSVLCTFQGWLVQMGFLSSTMWWGIVAFNMFLSVYFGKKLPTSKTWTVGLQVVVHVCGWAIPVFLMLIPAVTGQISFTPGATLYAFPPFSLQFLQFLIPRLRPDPEPNSCSLDAADVYFLVFWAIPIGIILMVGTLLFLASLLRLLQFARQLNELKKTCKTYFRVIIFILIYLSLITFIFAYSLRVVSAKDTIEEGYSDYYRCLILDRQACSLSAEVHNYGLAVLRSIGYSSLGLLLFFNFCISPSMGKFWWNLFKLISKGKFSSILTSDRVANTRKSPRLSTATDNALSMSAGEDVESEML
ncbi:hypothetical protein QOT17_020806 [Balamuthia mandrillaris]